MDSEQVPEGRSVYTYIISQRNMEMLNKTVSDDENSTSSLYVL